MRQQLAVTARALNPGAWLAVILVLAAWQVIGSTRLGTSANLESPFVVGRQFGALVVTPQFYGDLWHTFETTLLATAVATVVGVAIGVAYGLQPWFRLYSNTTIDFLRTVPVTALVPVALLIWGPSDFSEVAIACYAALWPIVINTASGVRSISLRLYDVATVLRFSRSRTVRTIVIPAATQSILVGARLGAVNALVIAIVAEMLINPSGLGWSLIVAQNAVRPELVWTYTVAIGLVAYAFNLVLIQLVRWTLPGAAEEFGSRGR